MAGFDRPIALLVISAVVGGFMMFLYSGLLIVINGKVLPAPIRIRGVRPGALIWVYPAVRLGALIWVHPAVRHPVGADVPGPDR
jgi:hypothetical protein